MDKRSEQTQTTRLGAGVRDHQPVVAFKQLDALAAHRFTRGEALSAWDASV
jgi:hypothetical protein